jgi:exosome complex component RRP42
MSTLVTRVRKNQIGQLLDAGKRLDDRGLGDYREIKVEQGIIERAEGSARVLLGKTEILVGVKIETGEPFPDTPNEGVQTVNAELVPLASADFEPGPPDENSIELARIVDRGIRESKAILKASEACASLKRCVTNFPTAIFPEDKSCNAFLVSR